MHVNETSTCTTWFSARGHKYLFYTEYEKTKVCEVIEVEEMELSRECVSF